MVSIKGNIMVSIKMSIMGIIMVSIMINIKMSIMVSIKGSIMVSIKVSITPISFSLFFPWVLHPSKNHIYGHILELLTMPPQKCIKLRVACKRTGP